MQKNTSRFPADEGQYTGEKAPTTDQKKNAKKTAAYLRSLKEEEKRGAAVIPR